ncbi:two-component sensor histidine kinase, partial [Nocardia farcinica]|nr:two-component sensor histidine kinase [Nocardia farcinica]
MIDLRARRDLQRLLRWLPLMLIPILLLASTYPGQYRVPTYYWLLALAAAVVFVAVARWPLVVSVVLSSLAVPMLRAPAWGVSGLVPYLGAVALVVVIARTHRWATVVVAAAGWAAAIVLGRVGLHETSIGRAYIAVEVAAYAGVRGRKLFGQRNFGHLKLPDSDRTIPTLLRSECGSQLQSESEA